MTLFGLTTLPLIIVAGYGIAVFVMTLMRPKWGLYALVPIIGLGFSDASAVKGGMVALVATGFLIHFLVHRETRADRIVAAGGVGATGFAGNFCP
jgi:hypothetical protein